LPRAPEPVPLAPRVNTAKGLIQKLLVLTGNSLTVIGCMGLLLGVTGLVDTEWFGWSVPSGVRAAGSMAVSGCVLSAVGYEMAEYLGK
jgi:hypothetical protein